MGALSTEACRSAIQKRLDRPLALFLDFDGTLVPIARRPELAGLDPGGRRLLQSVARRLPTVLVSGRSLADLQSRVGVRGAYYAGNHGLEIKGNRLQYNLKDSDKYIELMNEIQGRLEGGLEGIPGVLIENKTLTLSVHYRLVPGRNRPKAARIFNRTVREFKSRGRVRVTHGKAVWEVRPPVEWHKGRAVRWILRRPEFRGRWPLYIGDDRTDQDALAAVRRTGIGIWVGSPAERGAARFCLKDSRSVRQLLRWLLGRLSGKIGRMEKV